MKNLRNIKKGHWVWISTKVIQDLILSASAKIIYIVLAFFAKEKGICSPGIRKIAALSKKSKNTVEKSLKKLESSGYIEIVRNGLKKVSTYRLLDVVEEDINKNVVPASTQIATDPKLDPVQKQPIMKSSCQGTGVSNYDNFKFLDEFKEEVKLVCEKFFWTLNTFGKTNYDWRNKLYLTYVKKLIEGGYSSSDLTSLALYICENNREEYLKNPLKALNIYYVKKQTYFLRNQYDPNSFLLMYGVYNQNARRLIENKDYKPKLEEFMETYHPKEIKSLMQCRVFIELRGESKPHCPVKLKPGDDHYTYVEESEIEINPDYKRQILEIVMKPLGIISEYLPKLKDLSMITSAINETKRTLDVKWTEEDRAKNIITEGGEKS